MSTPLSDSPLGIIMMVLTLGCPPAVVISTAVCVSACGWLALIVFNVLAATSNFEHWAYALLYAQIFIWAVVVVIYLCTKRNGIMLVPLAFFMANTIVVAKNNDDEFVYMCVANAIGWGTFGMLVMCQAVARFVSQ